MNDIIELIGRFSPHTVEKFSRGGSYVLVRCPFHGGGMENTPSCSVSTVQPVFFCHSCQESGHIRKLFRQIGVQKEIGDTLIETLGFDARGHYEKRRGDYQLYHGTDPYRGRFRLDEEILDSFRLKPLELERKGFREHTLRHFEVGMDLDRARITFPLRNVYGDLVGISGRTVIDATPRYKIYKQELIKQFGLPPDYSMDSVKESIFWHGHVVYPFAFRTDDPLILCEGFKAAMWTWQAGLHDVMAIVGAYFSERHTELISRTRSPVILFLDNNEAGIKGTYHAGERLRRATSSEVRVARYPDLRQQPDELSDAEILQAIEHSYSYKEWRREHVERIRQDAWRREQHGRGRR